MQLPETDTGYKNREEDSNSTDLMSDQYPNIGNDVQDTEEKEYKNPAEQAAEALPEQEVFGGLPVTDQEWEIISRAAENSDNPDEELHRYASAVSFSREYDIPIATAMKNLDDLTDYQIGQEFKPTPTVFKSLQNSFKVAGITQDQTKLIEQWQEADTAGNEEEAGKLREQIEQLDQELYSLKDDTPRKLLTTFTKAAIENVPFMLDVAKSGLGKCSE